MQTADSFDIRRKILRIARTGSVFVLCLWISADPLADPQFGCQAQETAASSNSEEAARRRALLFQYTPRYRRLTEALASVQKLQAAGRSAEAIKTIQWLLDQPSDTFQFSDNQPLESVKRLAEARLRSFPEDWLRQYERIYGLQARQLLSEAQANDDESLAIEVLRRFGVTSAAADAQLWLAIRWLDRGEGAASLAVLLPKVVETEAIRQQSSAALTVMRRAAISTGDSGIARVIESELADREVAFRAEPEAATARTSAPRAAPAEQLTAGPKPRSENYVRDAMPVLRPQWTLGPVSVESSPHLSVVLDAWRGHLQELNLVPVSPIAPLVVRDQLILRTYDGLGGFDAASGRKLWTFACESSVSNWIDEAARHRRLDVDSGQMLPPELLQWWLSNNTQLGRLTSDGIRLYAVDSLSHPAAKLGGRGDPFQNRPADGPRPRESNRLLALQLPDRAAANGFQPPKLVWSQGRSLRAGETKADDRYFLGPPLPLAGRLLSLAEVDREIRLIAFQAESGAVIWEQPLATVDRSAVNDGERAFLACEPVPAGNLVICPTQAGILAAVDHVTGTLAWAYYDGDLPGEPAQGRRRSAVIARGRPGFAARTMVHRDRVLHLPANSSLLHCLLRTTGNPEWTAPRQRACTIAEVTDDLVILLEDRGCRAVRLQDGSEVWKQPLPAVTGTGMTLDADYLVPLDLGRFALLELATGKLRAWQPPRAGVSLGNLTACKDRVYSVGPQGLTAFPQLQSVRRMLQDSSNKITPAERAAWDVDLKLAEADLSGAELALQQALQSAAPADRKIEFQGVLRELLYHRLETEPMADQDILLPLQQLAVTPEERGRYLSRQALRARDAKNLAELRTVLKRLAELPMSANFVSAADENLSQSGSACCRQILTEMQVEFPEFVREFRQELLDDLSPPGSPAENVAAWRFALRVCAEEEAAGPYRDMLARRLERQGQRHAAELLWQQNRRHADHRLAADSLLGLMELSASAGWPRDAAPLLNEAARLDPRLKLRSGQTLAESIARRPLLQEARQWQARLAQPRATIRSAAIALARDLELPGGLQKSLDPSDRTTRNSPRFGEFSRRLTPGEPLTADVLVRMQGPQTSLMVVDNSTSQVVRHWPVPARHSHPFPGHVAIHGHFLPIGASGELRGYSLLELAEESPVWTQQPEDVQQRRAVPIIGPSGTTFVSFQAQNLLLVCDPWDGSLLWQRRDLEPSGGLYVNPGAGIVGDEHCISVFATDRLSYVTYDTMSGRTLHKGRLDIEPRQFHRAFGRKIFSVTQSRGQWHARVWDPLKNDWILQEPLTERNFAMPVVGSSEVAWLTAEGKLRVYDVPSGERTLDIAWQQEEQEGLNSLKLLTDGAKTYVNLQRNNIVVQNLREYHYHAIDTVLPCIHLRDDLYALDRTTGRVLWKRAVPSRTLLKLEPTGLPFLVLLSRIRDQHDNNLQFLLVEVLDAETGKLLAQQDRLPLDRIVNAEYDAIEQTVRLVGQKTTIEIHFSTGGTMSEGE